MFVFKLSLETSVLTKPDYYDEINGVARGQNPGYCEGREIKILTDTGLAGP